MGESLELAENPLKKWIIRQSLKSLFYNKIF